MMKIEELMSLIDRIEGSTFSKFEIKDGEFEMKLSREQAGVKLRPQKTISSTPQITIENPQQEEVKAEPVTGNLVKAPIVGVYYSKPGPEAKPYAQTGQQVKKGDVLFTIEAMKLFNEVTSEFDGTVKQILCKDGDMVEYGQPIMVIE